MSRDRIWSDAAYRKHLWSYPPEKQECDAAALLVRELNGQNDIALEFESRPDRAKPTRRAQTPKAPDFLYVDRAAAVRVAIEVKRPLLTETLSQRCWQTDLAEDIQKHLQADMRCIIWCDEAWIPPRRTARERQRRERMCAKIANVFQQEACRMGLRGLLQLRPVPQPWPCVDLTCILGTPAWGVVLTYGQHRSVTFFPTSKDFRPADIPPGQPWGLMDLSLADRRRYAAWCAAHDEPRRKAYRRLLADANAKFRSYRQSGWETIFLLDGRLENHLFPYEPETLSWFHQDAMDGCSALASMSPLTKMDFNFTQHVVVLGISVYGVQATSVWSANDAGLLMRSSSFLPEGWSADP